MLKLRLLISTLVSALIGFTIFMGWAIRELAEQFGVVWAILASACTITACLCIAAIFDDRQAQAPTKSGERPAWPADPSEADRP